MGNFFALYEFPALVPPRMTKLVVFDVHREGMGESCGEGSLVTLETEAKSKFSEYGYVCHDIFGDAKTTNMSEQQRLAEMIVPLIRLEQNGEKIPYPPPTLHALFYVHLPPSTILCSPPTLHHTMFTSHPPPCYTHLPPSTMLCSPPTLHHAMLTSHPPPCYAHLPPSATALNNLNFRYTLLRTTVTCTPACQNGGQCVSRNVCTCVEGYSSAACENGGQAVIKMSISVVVVCLLLAFIN